MYAVCVEERGGEVGVRDWEYDVQSGWDCVVKTARCVQDSKGGPAYPL